MGENWLIEHQQQKESSDLQNKQRVELIPATEISGILGYLACGLQDCRIAGLRWFFTYKISCYRNFCGPLIFWSVNPARHPRGPEEARSITTKSAGGHESIFHQPEEGSKPKRSAMGKGEDVAPLPRLSRTRHRKGPQSITPQALL